MPGPRGPQSSGSPFASLSLTSNTGRCRHVQRRVLGGAVGSIGDRDRRGVRNADAHQRVRRARRPIERPVRERVDARESGLGRVDERAVRGQVDGAETARGTHPGRLAPSRGRRSASVSLARTPLAASTVRAAFFAVAYAASGTAVGGVLATVMVTRTSSVLRSAVGGLVGELVVSDEPVRAACRRSCRRRRGRPCRR